ncbi:MAG: DUF6176 family protein [Thaumarchaeota archaeon]|nr:DUF6176 family protein [Nitrososphaerota archaeon]
MTSFVALSFPVLAGNEGKARDFASEVKNKRKDFEKSSKRLKIKRQGWFLQQLPGSSTLIVFMEADDVQKALSDFSQSADPFDSWLKDGTKRITGMDFNRPRQDPYPEILFSDGF